MRSPEQSFREFRQRADTSALAEVFDALAPQLLLVAAHVSPTGVEAEDLLQGTFLDAIEKAARWDEDRPLLPWLIGILVNRAREERRRRERTFDGVRLQRPEEPEPLDALAANEAIEQVATALRSLPRQLRLTLTMRLVHGLTPTEIAHALGCPIATAKTRLQRGMEWLRKVLPAGIGASIAGLVTAERGLAAVRTVVLDRAAELAIPASAIAGAAKSAVAVATGVVAGGLVMKKLLVVGAVLLFLAAAWAVTTWSGVPDDRGREPVAAANTAQAEVGTVAPDPLLAPNERAAITVAITPTTGSAEFEFVWQGEGTCIPDFAVSWCRRDHSLARDRAISDARGRLQIATLEPGNYELEHPLCRHTFTIAAGEVTRGVIEVAPFMRCSGVVVDVDGRPIAGAFVRLHTFDDWDNPRSPWKLAVTRDDGTFRGCAEHGGFLWAAKPGFAASTPISVGKGEATALRLVLGATAVATEGTVLDADGRPAADAVVVIMATSPANRITAPVVLQGDAAGRFSTNELAPGEHALVARAPGHAATPQTFTLSNVPDRPLEIRLGRGATIFGLVHASRGRVAVRPEWARAYGPLAPWCVDRVLCDEVGNYRLEHVPVGGVTLTAEAINEGSRRLDLTDGQELRCDFVPTAANEIRGRIVDSEGRPVTKWWAHAFSQRTGQGKSCSLDPEGRFHITDLAGDAYQVTAMPIEMSTSEAWIEVADVRPSSRELVLRTPFLLEDGGLFTGYLFDPAGQPVLAASGSYRAVGSTQPPHQRELKMRDGGRFELGPLPPGNYEVLLNVQGTNLQLGTHELPLRASIDLGTLRLPRSGTMELTFARPDGSLVIPSQVYASDAAHNSSGPFERDANSVHRSRSLPAGTYRVLAWGEDFAPLQQDVVVEGDRTTPTRLFVTPALPVHFELQRPAGDGDTGNYVSLRILGADDKLVVVAAMPVHASDPFTWTCALSDGRYTVEAKRLPFGKPGRTEFSVTGDVAKRRVEVRLPGADR